MQTSVIPWDESTGTCTCCGNTTRTVWGEISADGHPVAVYYASWTVGSAKHLPNFDLILGAWGSGTEPTDRVLVSLVYRPDANGGSFMVTDGDTRPANDPKLCGRALRRVEVVGTPLAQEVFGLIDAIWLQDPRIEPIKHLGI